MHSLVARKQGRGQGHLKTELKPTFEWLEALHEHGFQLFGRRLGIGAEHVRAHQDAVAQRRHEADPPRRPGFVQEHISARQAPQYGEQGLRGISSEQRQDTRDWDAQPVRPVGEFVVHLVQRLLE